MSKPVVMPQMGESVAEGTIVRWLKKVGDAVERDEPLFEISTDKVDAEIPSPNAGVLSEIRVKEGDTVPVNAVVATIDEAGASALAPGASAGNPAAPAAPAAPVSPVSPVAPVAPALRLSPVVRKIAQQYGVDVRNIAGSGAGGRVTRDDILAYVDAGVTVDVGTYERVPMTVMRRKIAEHMVLSKRTSPHVHSTFEVDFTKVDSVRRAHKAEYERAGGHLTYLSFITQACAAALKAVPVVNASVEGTDILYRKEINIGIAVALDWGLIVPVLKGVDRMSLLEISTATADLAARARDKKLRPEEVQEGTFTITNPGAFGTLFGLPIINQPQVAILAVGAVEKRPVVVDDAVTIRLRAYLTIGYDHRIVDGAVADRFVQHVKATIENWE